MLDVIANGEPRLLGFGMVDETAWQVGLSYGGKTGLTASGRINMIHAKSDETFRPRPAAFGMPRVFSSTRREAAHQACG